MPKNEYEKVGSGHIPYSVYRKKKDYSWVGGVIVAAIILALVFG